MSILVKIKDIIEPSIQVRESIGNDGVAELAESIKEIGLINAIQVKKVNSKYEIIAGQRRYLAHKYLEKDEIECRVINKSEEENEEIKLSENIIREDLNPIDLAKGLMLLENRFNITEARIAKKLGKSEMWVRNKIRLMRLPGDIIDAIKERLVNEKVGVELGKIEEREERKRLLMFAVANGATWKVVNDWVNNYKINRGIEYQIKDKEVSEAEISHRPVTKVKCMLCKGESDITEMRYEPCHKECYLELIFEMQKAEKES